MTLHGQLFIFTMSLPGRLVHLSRRHPPWLLVNGTSANLHSPALCHEVVLTTHVVHLCTGCRIGGPGMSDMMHACICKHPCHAAMLLTSGPGNAGPQAASAAAIAGHQPPALYTVGRDGALFTWVFQEGSPSEHGALQRSQPSTANAEAGLQESFDDFPGSSAPRPTATQSFFVDPWDGLNPETSAAEAGAPATAQRPWPGTAP